MGFTVVIPARHASTRLPGKMLLSLAGKPMIQHVYERASESGAERVVIATDHPDIVDAANKFNAEAILTAENHQSGTERIAEVVVKLKLNDDCVIVNVQGDEPLIEPEIIEKVAENLDAQQNASIATVATPLESFQDFQNPNIVKIVLDKNNYALYFSRAPIPWPRDGYVEIENKTDKALSFSNIGDVTEFKNAFYRHIGIYAYSTNFVKEYVKLPPSPLEKIEALEQLRALWNGYQISVLVSEKSAGLGIDTEEDYNKVKEIIERC